MSVFRETSIDEKNALAFAMSKFMSQQTITVVHSALCSLMYKQNPAYSPSYTLLHHVQYAFHYTIMFPNQYNAIETYVGPPMYITTGEFYEELFENGWKRRRIVIIYLSLP